MKKYIRIARQSFHLYSAYKLEYYLGMLGALLSIFITAAIWSAVYEGNSSSIAGITQAKAVTYAVIAMLLRTALTMNEFIVDGKIKSGEIAVDLLKPYKFQGYLFSMVIGEVGFNLWTKVLPLLLISVLLFQLEVSHSWLNIVLFGVSLVLAYLLLYFLNLIFWLMSFWTHQTWSLVTIKNAIVLLLSGATIPYWFLPDKLVTVVSWLPFKNIYFAPLTIILGEASYQSIWRLYAEQVLWIVLCMFIGAVLWRLAQRRLVIQGG